MYVAIFVVAIIICLGSFNEADLRDNKLADLHRGDRVDKVADKSPCLGLTTSSPIG